jgi:hypothetical protein
VCCLAISAGAAILSICFIAICATLFVEVAKLKTSSQESPATSDLSMMMLQLQQIHQNHSNFQNVVRNESFRVEAHINHLVEMLTMQLQEVKGEIERLNSSIGSTKMQLNASLGRISQQLGLTNTAETDRIQELNSSIEITKTQLTRLNQQLGMTNALVTDQIQQLNNTLSQLKNGQEVSMLTLTSIQMNLTLHTNSLDVLQLLHLGQTQASPVSSCAALVNLPHSFPSGYYWVRVSNGSAVRVYCDMTRLCGGASGGWMRVAELNSSNECPSGFIELNSSTRACVSQGNIGCHQGILSAHNFSYSKVCGIIIAYQVGSTDAFNRTTPNLTVADNYVDGISLTHGSPRQHIWTFAAGVSETRNQFSCPCIQGSRVSPPSFVGTDYFCETGNNNDVRAPELHGRFFGEPLWDGAGCGAHSTCCAFNTPPWFYKQLPQSTTDDIEMRVCTDELRSTEDIAIEIIDIYIQ